MTTTADAPIPAVRARVARPVYTRVAVGGLLLAAMGPLTMLVLGLVAGMDLSGEIGFFAAVIAVAGVAAVLVWRFGTWAKVVGAVVSVLAGMALFWTAFGLAYPAAFGDFLPGVMVPLGVALGLGGSIGAIVAGRRGNVTTEATATERRILTAAITVVAVAAVVSGVLNLTTSRAVADAGDAAPVTMADFAFAEGTYEASAGQATQFVVRNTDPFVHDFTIPELGVAVDLLPGAEAVVDVPAADAGTYMVFCTLHSDTSADVVEPDAMAATLTVR